jgi:hypothetical protein
MNQKLHRTKLNKNNSPEISLKTGTQTESHPLLREAATTIFTASTYCYIKQQHPFKNQK